MTVQVLLNILPNGAEIFRCDGLVKDLAITVKEQAKNPKLGLVTATANPNEIAKALNLAFSDAMGHPVQVLLAAPEEPVKGTG